MIAIVWWLFAEFARKRAAQKNDPQIMRHVLLAWQRERYDLNPALRRGRK